MHQSLAFSRDLSCARSLILPTDVCDCGSSRRQSRKKPYMYAFGSNKLCRLVLVLFGLLLVVLVAWVPYVLFSCVFRMLKVLVSLCEFLVIRVSLFQVASVFRSC